MVRINDHKRAVGTKRLEPNTLEGDVDQLKRELAAQYLGHA